MRVQIIFLAAAILISLSSNAGAQLMADDLFLIKFGYIPLSTTSFDTGAEVEGADLTDAGINDMKSKGFNYAVRAEYFFIFGIFVFDTHSICKCFCNYSHNLIFIPIMVCRHNDMRKIMSCAFCCFFNRSLECLLKICEVFNSVFVVCSKLRN